jgi:hypothetical protein
VLEAGLVIESRLGVDAGAAPDRWLESTSIEIVVVTGLNYGDRFSYALGEGLRREAVAGAWKPPTAAGSTELGSD